jgi:hypothetical protein
MLTGWRGTGSTEMSRADRSLDWVATILLARATVATAWAAYRITVNRRSALANRRVQIEVADSQVAKDANQRADNYVLAVVLFASSPFFAGISTPIQLTT